LILIFLLIYIIVNEIKIFYKIVWIQQISFDPLYINYVLLIIIIIIIITIIIMLIFIPRVNAIDNCF